ncbi:MAG: hypothetical protein V7L23_09140 [Nostoc sp.]|uniref:hypothetical protein n=1 Tax=Nostoc sp. TaxID=1180 RepID=UPI002FF2EFB2
MIRHWAWGIGHGALGIGHWLLIILPCSPSSPSSPSSYFPTWGFGVGQVLLVKSH